MREPVEFQIDQWRFKARPMTAERQLAVLVSVSPLLAAGFSEIIPFYVQLRRDGVASIADAPLGRIIGLLTPVSRELAKAPKGELWTMIGDCLECCEVARNGGWSPVWNTQAGQPQFAEIHDDLFLTLRVTFAVFEASFARFFPASLSSLIGGLKG